MTRNNRSDAEKSNIVIQALADRADNIKMTQIAEKFGISTTLLYKWIGEYKSGKYTPDQDIQINPGLLGIVTDDFNRLAESDTASIVIFEKGEYSPDNLLKIEVEKPDISDPDQFNRVMAGRVMEKIDWDIVGRGFTTE